jgi:hypothetical protein
MGKSAPGIAVSPSSPYVVAITGNGQWAPVAERQVVLPPEGQRERDMPQAHFLDFQVMVSASRRDRLLEFNRAQSEFAQAKAATRKAIVESQELMAEVDAVMAKR